MALVIADRVKETTTTTGTSTYTLAGAVDGFQSFAAVGNGNTTYYACTDGTDYEVGIGTYTASGTTLARTTIIESSNSDAAVNWGSGEKDIFVTVPAEKYIVRDASGNVSLTGNFAVSGTVDGRDIATDGTKLDGIESGATADQTAAEIRTLVGSASDSNVFTDADHSKLDGIEAGATADQTITAGSGLSGGGTGNVTLSHSDTSSQSSVNNSGRTYIQDITLDGFGHVTGISSATETVTNTDTNTTSLPIENSSGTTQFTATDTTGLQFVGSGATSVAFDSSNKRVTISSTDTNTDTNTTYSAGSGLSLSGTTFSHSDTSSQASSNNSGRTYIQDITLDTYGHVTGIATATETVTNTDTNTTSLPIENSAGTAQFTATDTTGLQFVGSGATSVAFDSTNKRVTISSTDTNTDTNTTYSAGSGLSLSGTTFSHSDTSSQSSVNNSGATVVQDVTLDTYGHVTGLASKTMTLADLGYTGATNANYITNNNQLTNGAGYTTFTANQNLNTNGEPNFLNLTIASNIYHQYDTDTGIQFSTDQVVLRAAGSNEVTVTSYGVRLGDTGNAYVIPVSGNYGSFCIDGGSHGGWEGYSIGGNWVFMSDNTDAGIYNDIDNEWMAYFTRNGAATLYYNGSSKFATSSTGATVTGDLNSTSDIRYKKNIETIDSALDKVQSLRGVTFNWDHEDFDTTNRATGVIAQDVEKVLPEAVRENEDGFLNVAYGNMVGLLVEAIKEQQQQIHELKKQLNG